MPRRASRDVRDQPIPGALENIEMLYYPSRAAFREDFAGDLCTRKNFAFANMCKLIKAAKAKCTARPGVRGILRGG